MATLINGDGNQAIYAQQDADWFASIMGGQTLITAVGNKFTYELLDANTIGVKDGVIITKEGRRIQLDANVIDSFDIPTGAQGTTNYYIIGYHLVTGDLSEQTAETFVQLMDNATDTIPEGSFRDGDDDVYISLYRVQQNDLTLGTITLLLPTASETMQQQIMNKKNLIDNTINLPDDTNLDSITRGVYSCFCTIKGVQSRYLIICEQSNFGNVGLFRQVAYGVLGPETQIYVRYSRFIDFTSTLKWSDWKSIDNGTEISLLSLEIQNLSSTVSGHTTSISNLEKKFDNHENNGEISDCNNAPSGVSMAVSTTANSPTPGTGFYILWTMSTGAVTNPAKLQIASAYSNDYYYFRDMFNGIWGSWKRLDLS